MKNLLYVIGLSLFLISCGSSDKKAQLDKLKKQHDALSEQIKTLETEIAKEGGAVVNKIVQVSLTEAKPQEFNHYIEVQGKVDGDENVNVSAKSMGVITYIFVKEGDNVRKGQVLAQIDDQVLQQSLLELKTQLTFATNIYDKQKNLWDQKIGSELQYLTAKNTKESLEGRMSTLIDQIDMSKIKSPINGTVEESPMKVGQLISPGFTAFRVVNFSKIKVVAEVAEAYTAKVRQNNKVKINFPDLNEEIDANIRFTSRYINPINRTFMVEARVNPGKLEFRANMVAVLKINDYSSPTAIVLPVNIIQTSNNEKFVYIVEDKAGKQTAKKQLVKVGQTYNGNVEILEGIKEGNKVITSGFQDLEDGLQIKL
jgi:RND family efflux transporter MFP subunit